MEQSCNTCKFCEMRERSLPRDRVAVLLWCHRYPTPQRVHESHWCGEWKRAAASTRAVRQESSEAGVSDG